MQRSAPLKPCTSVGLNIRRFTLFMCLVAATPISAFAQHGTTAELIGIAIADGVPLPGVTVTVSSLSLQGNRFTLTGENGGYNLRSLPPGSYEVRFEVVGMEAVLRQVKLSLAQTTRADVSMRLTPLSDSITVQMDSLPLLDTMQVVTSFQSGQVERLPIGRAIRDIVLLSPGVNANAPKSQIMISGAPSWDSLFLVDGVIVNENLSGQPHNLFIEDAIEEITVLTGAVSAEYGRFTGGVVTTRTKSGGNEYTGSLRDSISNSAWTARTPWPDQPDGINEINHVYEGTAGGYLLRDRLWFFTAARLAESSQQRFTAFTDIPYTAGLEEKRWEGKLSAQISPNQNLVASYLNTALHETNLATNNSGRVFELVSFAPERSSPTNLRAIHYNAVIATNVLLEGQYSQKRYSIEGNGGRSLDRIGGTYVVVRAQSALLNAPLLCGVCGDDERNHQAWLAKGSYYRNTRLGNHTVVAGMETFSEERIDNTQRSGSGFGVSTGSAHIIGNSAYPIIDNSAFLNWTPVFLLSEGTDLQTRGAFLNDRWDVNNRLSVNLGVRYDRNDGRDADGTVVSDDDAFSPRLGAVFDWTGNGRIRLSASYGRYVSKILDGRDVAASAQASGSFSQLSWRYRGPEINPPGTPIERLLSAPEALSRLFAWFDSVGGINNRQFLFFSTYAGYSARFPHSLTSPSVDEITLGFATRIRQSGHLKIDLIARDWHDFYAARLDTTTGQLVDPLGNVNDVAWIVNDDRETERSYRAVQLQSGWRSGRWNLGGGYTWSKLRGNDEGEEQTQGYPPKNLPLTQWYPEYLGYTQRRPIGYLNQDQRHRARVWVACDLPTRIGAFNASLLQLYDSARAYSAVGEIDATGISTPFPGRAVNPGYSFSQSRIFHAYYFGERGQFRTNDVLSTDLALNYELPMRSLRLFLQAELFNLFDQQAVVAVDTEVVTRQRSGPSSGLVAFNPFTEKPVQGVHYRLGPNFGKPIGPSSYQTPRTYQFSIGVRF